MQELESPFQILAGKQELEALSNPYRQEVFQAPNMKNVFSQGNFLAS